MNKKESSQLFKENFQKKIGTLKTGFLFAKTFSAVHQGIKYQYMVRYESGGDDVSENSYRIRIKMDCPAERFFRIARKGLFNRFAKKVKLLQEVQTGYAEFDDAFFIEATDTENMDKFFKSPDIRKAIRALFNEQVSCIGMENKTVSADWEITGEPSSHPEIIDRILNAVLILHELSRIIIKQDAMQPTPAPDLRKFKRIRGIKLFLFAGGGVAVLAAFLVFGISNWKILGDEEDALFLHALPYSLAAWAFITVACTAITRALNHVVSFFLYSFLFVLAFYLLSLNGMEYYNRAYDTYPPASHTLDIIKKESYENKMYLEVPSWRKKGEIRTIKVFLTESQFQEMDTDTTQLILTTRPGYLGYEWIVSYRLVSSKQSSKDSFDKF